MTKLAVVTGASSGIGRAFAQRLAADGYDLVAVGRRRDRLEELAASMADVNIQILVADLSTDEGIEAVADVCGSQPREHAGEQRGRGPLHANFTAARRQGKRGGTRKGRRPYDADPRRGAGNDSTRRWHDHQRGGMIAFSGPVPNAQGRAVYAGTLAHLVAMTQVLHEELKSEGLKVQVVCPGIVATEFHERQGLDLSALPRMSAGDVVSASLRGLELGEVVCAPGVEEASLLEAVFRADLAAFGGQSHQLAVRYRTS